MWHIPRSNGLVGPLKTQNRAFSGFSLPVNILPEKSFKNPNFVNDLHPNIHSPNYNRPQTRNYCQNSDIPDIVTEKSKIEKFTNSSQNTAKAQPAKESPCECPSSKSLVESNPMCYSRKRSKKVRRSCKKKVPNKNSKQNNCRRYFSEMMEVDLEPDISVISCDSSTAPISPKCLNLNDFIVDSTVSPNKSNKTDDEVFTVISISPPINKVFHRERDLSLCESEDSFIVFDSGTDEELKFSDSDDTTELESEDDGSDSDIDDDFDSSYSVVPCKRVRFADKEDLCEVHPMVQWSFAYRKARKGPWEEYARDRERFNKRINETEAVLGPIFNRQHRENVYKERFDDNVQ